MSIIKRQTILGTLYSYIGVVVGTLTMALIVPNFFSVEEYGLINILSRCMMVLVVAASLGFNNAGTRFFRYFRDPQRNHSGYLFNGLCVLGVGLLLSALFLYFFKDWILKTNGGDNSLFVKYYYLILPITLSTGVFNLFDNYAKGLYDTVMGTFLSQLLQRVLVLCCVVVYIAGGIDFNAFMYWWVAAISAPMLFMIIHSMRLGNFSLKPDRFLWRSPIREEFFRFAGFSVLTGLSTIVITALDTMMVYRILGLGMSGIYNFCLLFGSVMTMSYNANVKAATPIVMDAIQKKRNLADRRHI
ncbi:MAG: oligosaccharide flippase family protein [Leadbetterella sp.]|nr:oligosaccharide flippase family protein [Leadbetterella sp.]